MTIPSVLKNKVIEIPNFVSPKFCQSIIKRAKNSGFEPATITTENGVSITPDIRNNDRVTLDDVDLAEELWRKISPYFREPFKNSKAVSLNERFRIYKYSPGQFFDWHQDGEYQKDDTLVSRFTMMVYLNDTVTGGGTSFADVYSPHTFADFTVIPVVGKTLLFHHPLSHRGDPILSGEKYVLRTDVMFEQV